MCMGKLGGSYCHERLLSDCFAGSLAYTDPQKFNGIYANPKQPVIVRSAEHGKDWNLFFALLCGIESTGHSGWI